MIFGLHWSLIALIELCAGCALLNYVQRKQTGQVRVAGLMICGVWAWQQMWWVVTGADNLPLWLTCDALMLWFFWQRRATNDNSDWLIAALIAAGPFIYIPEFTQGQTVLGWWTLRGMVAAEMMLGLPRLRRQLIQGSVSHGRLYDGGT